MAALEDNIDRAITKILEPIDTVTDRVERAVHNAMDSISERFPPTPRRILFESQHRNLVEAALADLVGEIPFAEFLIKPFRIREAAKRGSVEEATRHAVDWAIPLPLPANIRSYIENWRRTAQGFRR